MKKMKHVVGVLLAFGAASVVAQVPSGHFIYSITNPPLWDVTGSYTNHTIANGHADTVIMDLAESATGKLTGTRRDSVSDGTQVTANITGKVAIKRGVTGAKVKMKGTVHAGGYDGPATGKGTATFDPVALSIEVVGSMKLCVKTPRGKMCETLAAGTTSALPAGTDGDWTLETDITASGDKLSGTGTITLSNGRVFNCQVTGSYNATTEDAKLKLVGEGDAAGVKLSILTHGPNMDVTALTGKILGLKLIFP